MKKLTSFLNNIYGHVSDAVFVYQLSGELIYQNEPASSLNEVHEKLRQPILDKINNEKLNQATSLRIHHNEHDLKVSTSSLTIDNKEVIVAIIAHQEYNNAQSLPDKVKHLLLQTSVNNQSFYSNIGELVKNSLQLNNLQITIPNQWQKELVSQYFSKDHSFLLFKENQQKYIHFVQILTLSEDLKSTYTQDELAIHFNIERETSPIQYFFTPIKFQNNVIGGIGIFEYSSSNKITHHLRTLQTIADYIGIFYRFQHLEEELLQQTSRLNAIFESSSDLIWSVDSTMEVVSFNQNYFRAIFYKYQGGIVTEHFKNDVSETSPFDEFWEVKYQKVFKGHSLHFEIELKHPNNVPAWKEIFLMPIFKANGTIEEVSGIARDISERKSTVEALHQEEEKFKQIFDSFQDLYVRIDLEGKINMVSPSVKTMIGYNSEEVLGQDVTDYYLYNIQTKIFFGKIIQSETLRNIEIQLVGKSGKIIPCICNVRVIKNKKGIPVAIEGICRDITEIQQTNEELVSAKSRLEISLKTKEQFLANMSHEIRTPMNGIIGLLDMMLDTRLTDKQTKYLSTIKQSSNLLLNLLNDILDLSKINAGKLQINNRKLSIRHLLENIEILFSAEVEQKQLDFSMNISENVPDLIKSDKLRLLQIISNLISNAIKFTPEKGKIRVDVEYLKSSTIKVSVIDTGIGIDAKNVKKLFKNFTQINESYSEKFMGAGLGLAISKNLVKLLGGKIDVKSAYGKGSIFWFTFNTKVVNRTSTKELKDVDDIIKKPKYNIAKKSILVVDDNATNRMVAHEILLTLGMSTESADNAKLAIELVLKKDYDIIFMDIQMPKIDGIQAMTMIKDHNPKQVVIAMTAYDEQNQSAKFIELGFNGYLAKPITPETIVNVISGVLINNHSTSFNDNSNYDFATIKELTKYVDLNTMTNTYRGFEKSIIHKIELCQNAFVSHSYSVIYDQAHSIKGDAATIGLKQIAAKAGEIEKNINKEHFASLENDLKTLYLIVEKVPDVTKEIIKRLSHEYKNINS